MAMVHATRDECGIVLSHEKYDNVASFLSKFDVPQACRIEFIKNINLGMNYLHTHSPPVIHGDLKTLNILIGEGFVAKVCAYTGWPKTR